MYYFENYHLLYPSNDHAERHIIGDDIAKQFNISILTNFRQYFSDNIQIIAYRQQLFRELDTNSELKEFFDYFKEKLDILNDLCQKDKKHTQGIEADHRVRDLVVLSFYTELIKELSRRLDRINLTSSATLNFKKIIAKISESEEFNKLSQSLGEISVVIESIKSITVGVNLDAQLRPIEAGVVSFNSEYYKSGEWIDKLLRMDFSESQFSCIASMTRLSKKLSFEENQQFKTAINNALDKVMTDAVKNARKSGFRVLKEWAYDVLKLKNELDFVVEAYRLIQAMSTAGGYYCYPVLKNDGNTEIYGLYHLMLAQNIPFDQITPNNYILKTPHKAIILTGPNSGGKTIYSTAVAICYLLAGLGLPIPARKAEITPLSQIKLHFPSVNANQYKMGRLEEECKCLAEIQAELIPNAMIFMDETFSSTGAEEASMIAEQYIERLTVAGAKVLFSTHLHSLAKNLYDRPEISSLTVELGTYKVIEDSPNGSSCAERIARQYGII